MPGDRWRQLANLRAYLAFLWAHPGKKLLFMGGELGQETEWNHDEQLAWHLLEQDDHARLQRLVGDLNRLYRGEPALHRRDSDPGSFEWLVGGDAANSVFAFLRKGDDGDPPVAFAVNMTPQPHQDYRLPLPREGRWRELLNTDAETYGGSGLGNSSGVEASGGGAGIVVPPLAALMLRHEG
jgi:1,4-alpha-glucan branching enzyme